MRNLIHYLRLLRPGQWIKNGFVIAPLIFSGRFLEITSIKNILLATLLFCLASSTSYIVNDIYDLEKDRLHPKKKIKRPLAAGQVSIEAAFWILGGLYILLILGFFIVPNVMLIILIYLILNLAYSFKLKNIPIVDIFLISSGFVLRIIAGTVALKIPLSPWMVITTFSLALYLATIKRQQELISTTGGETRDVLSIYTKDVLLQYAQMSAVCAIMFYSIYVLISDPLLIASIPIVLFGIFRYWLIVEIHKKGESPTEALYKDKPLLITVLIWIIFCMYALWP